MNQELPILKDSEFRIIKRIRDEAPARTLFQHLRKIIIDEIPRLDLYTNDSISKSFFRRINTNWELPNNLFSHFSNPFIQMLLKDMVANPNRFLMYNNYPLFFARIKAKWVEEEDQLLIDLMNQSNGAPNFAIFSLCFPGRNGGQAYQRFLSLLKEGKIRDPRGLEIVNDQFESMLHRYLLDDAEKSLTDELLSQASNGIQVSKLLIREYAEKWFKHPGLLAERACYQMFSERGLIIYEDEDHGAYTDDFIEQSKAIEIEINAIVDVDESEFDEIQYNAFLQKNNLRKPIFSDHWIKLYMKRNRVSWRSAHYIRRGAIDTKYVKYYIDLVAKAFCRYGESLAFNMDETSIRVNNGSTKTIGRIGLEEIVINNRRNSKECFTTIATCSIKEKKDLIILTKGKTELATLKFRTYDRTPIWETGNQQCWVNSEIMEKYLEHVYEHFADSFPCALILDCYSAHRTKEVKKLAKKLQIELIFVPANGTSLYQPLDRRIFGIVKSKLRSLANSSIYSGKDRYKTITNQLLKAWSEVSDSNLESAWNIKGLAERYNKIKGQDKPNETLESLPAEHFDLDRYLEEEDDLDDFDEEEDDTSDFDYR